MTNTVFVCVAHPDDEVLLCGATMARHVLNFEPVHVLIMSSGVGSREGDDENQRLESLFRASQVIGYTAEVLTFPDQRIDTVPILEITQEIEKRVQNLRPTLVYTHSMKDLNKDHRVVSQAVHVACRPQPGCPVKTLLTGEVPSSTEWGGGFDPNWFVDVSGKPWEAKMDALDCYASEMRPWPHPRSQVGIQRHAQSRGVSVGLDLCEAFEMRRRLV